MDAFSVIATLLTVLGTWTAISFIATPFVVLCLVGSSRSEEQCMRDLRRRAWLTATQA